MTTYYVDPDATGMEDGSTWDDAWVTMQDAVDGSNGTQPTAGDTVLMRGEEASYSTVSLNGSAGSTSGRVAFVGVNASGTEDGTRYVIDGSSHMSYGMQLDQDYIELRNIEIKDCNSHGFYKANYSAADFLLMNNCYIHDNSGYGYYAGASGTRYGHFIACRFEGNTSSGWFGNGVLQGCISKSNDHGFYVSGSQPTIVFIDCMAIANTGNGWRMDYYGNDFTVLHNCVADGNGTAGYSRTSNGVLDVLSGMRLTENGTGIECSSSSSITSIVDCYMPASTEDRDNTTNLDITAGLSSQLTFNGSNTNDFSGTDSGGGYENAASGDFQTASTASKRAVARAINATTDNYITAGLPPSAGGGGSTIIVVEES